jgi:endonuclease-3
MGKRSHAVAATRLLIEDEVEAVYRALEAAMPGRTASAKGPKGQPDAFRSCISCMLSAQSRDANTAKAARQLFALAKTPRAMLALDDEVIAQATKPSGLYNMKARNIRKFCAVLLDEHAGLVPSTREGLLSLPGIGRKCADIVMSFTFGEDVIAVDTHIHRVANRMGLARGKTEAQTAQSLEDRSPDWAKRDGHFWLLQLGKQICQARLPKCHACPVRDVCAYPQKT